MNRPSTLPLASLLMLLMVVSARAQDHFTPVTPTGLPYAIAVQSADMMGSSLVAGDEIGVFDGDLCVGAAEVTGDWPLPITAWEGNGVQDIPGFESGNPILFKLWDASAGTEARALGEFVQGDGGFGGGFGSEVDVVADDFPVQFQVWCQDTDLPSGGGTLEIGVQLWSSLGITNSGVAFWTAVTTPGGQTYDALTVVPFTHTPFMSALYTGLLQTIPAVAPAGTYEFHGRIGFYPSPVLNDTFTFTKQGAMTTERLDRRDLGATRVDDGFLLPAD